MSKSGVAEHVEASDSRRTIGLLLGRAGEPYQSQVWPGVADLAAERDVNLICFAGRSPDSPIGFDAQSNVIYDLVDGERVDGLLLMSGTLGNFIDREDFERFCERYTSFPLVSIALELEDTPSVLVDNEHGMRALVTHLIEAHGYRRIAFIRGPESHEEANLRYQAYVDVLAENDIVLDPDLVAVGNFVAPSGGEAIRLLLDERDAEFDAIIAANDDMALGALEALQTRGIRVPGDVAVAGFDDVEESRYATPPLTTVRQPLYQQGRKAAEMLLALLDGEDVSAPVRLPTEVVFRRSCGCFSEAVRGAAIESGASEAVGFDVAFGERREKILAAMSEASGSTDRPGELVEVLLDAFLEDLNDPTSDAFLPALDNALHQVVAQGGDPSRWQGVISALRNHTLPLLREDPSRLSRAETAWQQGRILVGETAKRVQASRTIQKEERMREVGEIGEMLLTAFEMEELADVVARALPSLGVDTCYISLYDGPEAPSEESRLIAAYDGAGQIKLGAEGRRFASRRLLPDHVWPDDRRSSLVVESLHFRDQRQLGFVIFDLSYEERVLSELMSEQISVALMGALLMDERREAEATVEHRAVQLQTAAQVSRTAGSILDPAELTHRVVELIAERFDLYYAGLFLVEGDQAVLQAGTGEPGREMLEEGHSLAVGGESMIGQSVARQEARIALDVGQEAVRFDNPHLPETRSELALPLVSRGRTIGALTIQSDREAAFSEEDIAVLQTMADQVANAIANARLYDELAEEQVLMNSLMESLPDHIYFKDRESHFLRISRSQADRFGLDRPEEAVGKTDFDFFTADHARPAYEDEQEIIETGEPKLNIEERETWSNRPDTWVVTSKLPLRDEDGNIIGTFGISSDITERKQAEEALARRALQLQTASEVSRAASSMLDAEELIDRVVELMRERFDLYYAGLFLVDEAGEWAVLEAATGEAGQEMLEEGHRLAVGGESMIGQCVVNEEARIAFDVGEEAVRFDNPHLPETRSELALPLISRGEVIGALTIQSTEEAAFSDEDITVFQTVADQLANAIQNARLFEQTQEALREIETVHRRYLEQEWSELARSRQATDYVTEQGLSQLEETLEDGVRRAVEEGRTVPVSREGDGDGRSKGLVVPVTVRGTVIGTLGIEDEDGDRQWTSEEITLIEAIAERMGLAAESLRLLDQTQKRASRERLAGEITSRMRQTMDLNAVLQTAVREMRDALDLEEVEVRMGLDLEEETPTEQEGGNGAG